MKITEDQIDFWARSISDTEEEKCLNAISMVTDAMREHFGNGVTIIHQGSHKNRTNIRVDSDVDIAVVYDNIYFSDVDNLSESDKVTHWGSISNTTYSFENFKTDVHQALIKHFGVSPIERKNKCIRVDGNSYRVFADVVPAFESYRFSSLGKISHDGIGFITDEKQDLVHSYPEQHYQNGVDKNDVTSNAYKAVVRVLKNARNEMVDRGIIKKDDMPSFFLECLVWNVPDDCFKKETYREDARSVTATIYSHMKKLEQSQNYTEISRLKWLLREAHRTPKQAESFMLSAFSFLEK